MSNRISGRRYDDGPRLNMKKVFATVIAIIVIIMIIVSLKKLLTNTDKTKDVSTLVTYIPVYESNKWGVIDNKGNKIINSYYDEMIIIPNKNKGLFICNYDIDYNAETYKTKVLNEKNEEILTDFNNITAVENTDGNIIWYEDNTLKFEKDGKYGLIDFDGKILINAEYDDIYALQGVEKSIVIIKDGKMGLVNTSLGEIIIPTEYVDISSLTKTYENGYIVKNGENKVGVIGADKREILDVKYDDIKHVTGNNYYVVVENGVVEVIDSSGQVVLNSGFDSIEEIDLNNFVVINNNKYGVINRDGTVIINPEYDNLKLAFSNYYIAGKEGKYGIITTAGNEEVEFKYQSLTYIKEADFFEGEREDLKTDIIDRNFNVVLEGVIVSDLNIENGYLRIRIGDEYKYYNFKFEEKTNKEVMPTNTLFLVKEFGRFGYENKEGKRIVDCIYDDAKEQNEYGYCAIKKDGLWGAIRSDGTVVVKPSINLDNFLYIDFISEWHRYNDASLSIYTK